MGGGPLNMGGYQTSVQEPQQPTWQQMGVGQQQGQWAGLPGGPQYASRGGQFSSVAPSQSTAAGFIPPPQGYGVPTTQTQQVSNTYPPSQLSGVTPQAAQLSTQLAGYTPMNTQPNYNMMMGGTTGYKSTMK